MIEIIYNVENADAEIPTQTPVAKRDNFHSSCEGGSNYIPPTDVF